MPVFSLDLLHVRSIITGVSDVLPRFSSAERLIVELLVDHGELFGEGDYFGHGPIQHEKVFEVPFVEGKIR